MATGFIYTVRTVKEGYVQSGKVPTQWRDRIYFGPCKRAMRPRIKSGDYIFGISPSGVGPRRVVFVGHVEERITFRDAYERFPDLRGPEGPIHVRPANHPGEFPHCSYEHIQNAIHKNEWERDLASRDLDAFFVCAPQRGCVGRWLGEFGPEVDADILNFLKTCSVHGRAGKLSSVNKDATPANPIAHGKLYTGLHLETERPEDLVELCNRVAASAEHLDAVLATTHHETGGAHATSCKTSGTPMRPRSPNTSQILFLRIGMDLGYGSLGPLLPDGAFEYVPIPDDPSQVSERTLFFREIPARSGGSVDRFVPAKHRDGPAHYDPEFKTFTYGDPTKNKRRQLLRLGWGDMLVFYAGLRPPEQTRGSKLYIIGYLVIRQVHAITSLSPWPPPAFEHLWGNAHLRRKEGDKNLVVVEGDPTRSRLLTRAVPLSDENQDVLSEMTEILGLSGSVKRAGAGRWAPEHRVEQVAQWLRDL